MSKASLHFDLPQEYEEFQDAIKGSSYKNKLEEVWNNVFRPYRKHGYNNQALQNAIEKYPEIAEVIIENLIEIYNTTVNEE